MINKFLKMPFRSVEERIKKVSTIERRFKILLEQIEYVEARISYRESAIFRNPSNWVYRNTFFVLIRSEREQLRRLYSFKDEYERTGNLGYLSSFNQ